MREVMGISEHAPNEVVLMDSALGIIVNPGDCKVCWLYRCRLADDRVEIEWESAYHLLCHLAMTRIVQ
jgi:hypothetical protein